MRSPIPNGFPRLPGLPDPFEVIRNRLSRAAAGALDHAVAKARRSTRRAVNDRVQSLVQQIEFFTSVLGYLSHGAANIIADSFRDGSARPLTSGEAAWVDIAFSKQPVTTSQVRIQPGPGKQPLALSAFMNRNPAITIGNTFYIKPSVYREKGGQDLSKSIVGIELLLHEYTHILQYARLGFARFGRQYAREYEASGWDANKMYQDELRSLHYNDEMIEGQAEIVGAFAGQLATSAKKDRDEELIRRLRQKLRGTGIFGN